MLCVEEHLFFREFNFHRLKLHTIALRCSTMQTICNVVATPVKTLEATSPDADARRLGDYLKSQSIKHVHVLRCCRRLAGASFAAQFCNEPVSPVHLSLAHVPQQHQELSDYYAEKGRLFQTDFYILQRKKLKLLVDAKGNPQGGKWSYDAENRLRYPKDKTPPKLTFPAFISGYASRPRVCG